MASAVAQQPLAPIAERIDAAKKTLNKLKPEPGVQSRFVDYLNDAIPEMPADADALAQEIDERLTQLREDLHLNFMMHQGLYTYASRLGGALRAVLLVLGLSKSNPGRMTVHIRYGLLLHGEDPDGKERSDARRALEALIASARSDAAPRAAAPAPPPQAGTWSQPTASNADHQKSIIATGLSKRRPTEDHRLLGDATADSKATLQRISGEWRAAKSELSMPRELDASLLHHCLAGAAAAFFWSCVRSQSPPIASVPEAWRMLAKKFEAPAAHQQQRSTIKSIRLASHQKKSGAPGKADALRKIIELIRVKAPLCGEECQAEPHKIDYLSEHTLIGEAWASEAISKSMIEHGSSFEDFAASLAARADERDRSRQGSPATLHAPVDLRTMGGASDASYGEAYAHGKRNAMPRRRTQRRAFDGRRVRLPKPTPTPPCLRCGRLGHFAKQCRAEKSWSGAIVAKASALTAAHGERAPHIVLRAAAGELGVEVDDDGEDPDAAAAAIAYASLMAIAEGRGLILADGQEPAAESLFERLVEEGVDGKPDF